MSANFMHLKFETLELEFKKQHPAVQVITDFEDGLPIVKRKWNEVLSKNAGFKTICSIADILKGNVRNRIQEPLSAAEISAFKVTPLTTAEIELSFFRF